MENLNLQHPHQIDIAVPANLKSGRPDKDIPSEEETWANLNYTFAGIWEITPQSLEEVHGKIQIIDVREPIEYNGPMGHIADSKLIPLGELEAKIGEINPDIPIITVCRGGGRSAQATVILKKAGFNNVANLAGGMLRWRSEGHHVVGEVE